MDIVLEVFDTLIADRAFAAAFPTGGPSSSILQDGADVLNGTASAFGGSNGYVYKPASAYFNLEPSKWAYMSSIPRDNIYRQAVSLYLITWYVRSIAVTVSGIDTAKAITEHSLTSGMQVLWSCRLLRMRHAILHLRLR